MPPRRRHYTIQHRLWLLEQLRIRRAAGLPLHPEEDFEEVGEEEEEELGVEEEEEQELAEEAPPLAVGKDQQEPAEEAPPLDAGEEEAPAVVDLWPEQLAIPNSIRSESAAEARHLHRQQMKAAREAAQAIDDDEA